MQKFKQILLIILFGVSSFTHLYRIDKTYIFQNDEGRDALIAFKMIESRKPILLGPETSVGNMYLGPFYYYLMVPALLASNLDPVGPAIMVGLFGIVTTFLIFKLGKRMFNFQAGFIAALFYALSPVMVHYSRSSWNPNVVPFFITCLLLSYPLNSRSKAVLFGIFTGIIFQLHYVALLLPALLILSDIVSTYKSKLWNKLLRNLLWITLGFLFSSSPFWLFEIRHAFVNSQAFISYLIAKGGSETFGYPPYFLRLLNNFKLTIGGIFASSAFTNTPPGWYVYVAGGLLTLTYFLIYGGQFTYLMLASLIGVSFLKENINVHYLSFLFPIAALMLGAVFALRNWQRFFAIFLIIFLVIPFYKSLDYNLSELESSQPKRAKQTAEYILREAAGRPYNVVNYSTSSTSTILYYLAISNNPPKNTDQTLLYVICENQLCPSDILTSTSLFLNGPSHPTIIDYLGYTPRLEMTTPREMLKNEWVTYDVHLATVALKP